MPSAIRATLDAAASGPVIHKNIYGHFAEHLGRCIYEGLWVGPDSDIPNTRGWRDDSIAALRELRVPVVRWPGGCFADTYHWLDGVGPPAERPVQVNSLWGGVEETNEVGTHEYFDLIEQLGADAYVNGNLGTGTPQEMAGWLEYMTSDSESELAQLRRRNGRDQPWAVQFFGVGNEAWGCGGHMTPEYYTDLYKHWGTFLRTPWDARPKFVASGGHGEGTKELTRWSDYLTANIEPDFLLGFDAVNFHYYTHPKGDVMTEKGAATQFPESEWISTLSNTLRMDSHIQANKDVMDKNNPEKSIGLYIDEWGTWYDNEEGTNPAFLYQQNSLRDAVVAALNFNIFHKHADRVHMTNIAQLTNVLQAMLLTNEEGIVRTPTFYVYKMYLPFQGATSLPLELSGVESYAADEYEIPAVHGSAARAVDGSLVLALVNTNPRKAAHVEVAIPGEELESAAGHVLTAAEMDAHNTFENPHNIVPAVYTAVASDGRLELELPAKSVIVVSVRAKSSHV